jgi:5-methylcytosine-specific restriction enzyme subunit McrC
MIKDRSIAIANIYYMLSYAYQSLQQKNYEEIMTEAFENVQDLFAAILAKGMMAQFKQGISRKYVEKQDTLSTLRGKIDIRESMQLKMCDDLRLSCRYDELSENHYMNQILKTTALCLIYGSGVERKNKDALKKAILFLSEVDTLEPSAINWRSLHYNRNNASYRMLMNICYLVLHELLLTTEDGGQKLATFLDDQQMSRLYEKFVLEYYKKHFSQYIPASRQIKWDTDGIIDYLPIMQSDIMLTDSKSKKKLIIDTKYYGKIMQMQYDAEKLQSNNLYQIFAYVKK